MEKLEVRIDINPLLPLPKEIMTRIIKREIATKLLEDMQRYIKFDEHIDSDGQGYITGTILVKEG